MAACPPASTTTARSSSTPARIAISTTAMPLPVTVPGPHRRTRPRSRRYQRPPRPSQLPLRLRLHLPRQPPSYPLHRRPDQTCPPVRSRRLENLRLGNQPSPIRRARTRDRDLTAPTIYDGGIAMPKMTAVPENYNNIRAEIV